MGGAHATALAANDRSATGAQIAKAACKRTNSIAGTISGDGRRGSGTCVGQKQCGGVR